MITYVIMCIFKENAQHMELDIKNSESFGMHKKNSKKILEFYVLSLPLQPTPPLSFWDV
jgi:hypothetical protein